MRKRGEGSGMVGQGRKEGAVEDWKQSRSLCCCWRCCIAQLRVCVCLATTSRIPRVVLRLLHGFEFNDWKGAGRGERGTEAQVKEKKEIDQTLLLLQLSTLAPALALYNTRLCVTRLLQPHFNHYSNSKR